MINRHCWNCLTVCKRMSNAGQNYKSQIVILETIQLGTNNSNTRVQIN